MPNTVKVPKEFEPIFEKAQEYVSKYFKEKIEDPSKGTIEIFGERYILIRAASMSVDFFETVKNLYRDKGDEEALNVARSLLFDIAHAIGKTDAKNFHKKMDLKSPIEKLSAGPIHFSHSGWAFVDIFPESRPSPDENYFLIYDHPFSFESDAWMKAGRKSDFPVCVMNAGYSSGWCEESFGISLVASEIMCRAKGDEVCRFIMAHPSKIEDYIKEYLKREPELAKKVIKYEIPGFFKRKEMEEALRRAHDELEIRVQERTVELGKTNKELQTEIVERKLTEETLRQSENKYRTLVENLPQKIFLKDKNDVYISSNENYASDLKIRSDEITGKNDYDFYPRELAEKYRADDRRIIESGKTEDLEERYIQDGREVWVHTVKIPVKDKKGQCVGLLGIFWDVTELKRAEEALRESEERLKLVVEGAELGTWDQNMKTGEVIRNRRWAEMLGYTLEEIEAHTDAWKALIHPDDLPAVNKITQDHRAGLTPFLRCEHRMRTKSGEWKWILNCGKIIQRDKDGKPLRATGTHMDITERKRAEEALRESEEKYSTIVEKGNDGIVIIQDGLVKFTNSTITAMVCVDPGEVIGEPFIDLVSPAYREIVFDRYKKRISGQEPPNRYEIELFSKDGKKIPVEVSASLIEYEGRLADMAIVRDITERKRAEQALIEAKEQAEAANRLKSEFLANMSHEIRTPMNAIIGMTGITLDTDLTGQQREYLNIVKESGYALLGLLDDILDLSKIEAGRMGLDVIDFDLRTTIEGVADTLAARASAKGLELACMIHYQVPTLLRGDPGRLRQILMNLGGNAVKFTEKGEVVIRVELSKETEDQATLLFSVTDTGIGIPKDKQEKIFESFVQADGSATRKYGGAGLGLSISRRLVKLLGGQIGVESQPGKGSRFWFTVTFEKQKEFKEISLTLPSDICGLRILVVDDNQTNRTILVKMLESFGCSPEAIASGNEAIQSLKRAVRQEKPFDLVLLDMQMPEMDGEETLRAIKADPELKDVLVIILTSIGIRGDAVRLEALGCAGYLTKPVKQSQLFDTILTVLSRQKAQAKEKPLSIVTRHTIAEQKRRRAHILVAEDNPMNQKLVVILLKKAGYSVDAVEDGRMVMEAVKRRVYDLILMDVQMPEMNGFEATQAIRAREGEAKHTPIIAMTAHAMKGDRERCLQAGMDDYISKPIEPQEFFDAIEKWTKSRDKEKDLSPSTLHLSPQKSELALSEHIEPVEPIDLESALRRFDGDKEFFKEMLREFLSYAPKQLEKLAEAIKRGEAKVVEREAHSLKGGAGNLGAKPIADLALRLEFLGRTKDLAEAKKIIGNLKAELKRLEEYSNLSFKGEIALKT